MKLPWRALPDVADVTQDQLGREDAVAVVVRLAGEVELGGQDGAVGGLDLDVDVAGPAGVEAGHDRLQPPGAVGVAELVAAQAVALVVVLAGVVGLPEVEQGPLDRAAVGGQHGPGDDQALPAHAGLQQRGPLGRVRGEVGAFGLRGGRVVAVVAGRGGGERPRGPGGGGGAGRGRGRGRGGRAGLVGGGVVAGGQHHRQGQGQAELEQPAPGQARGVDGWIGRHGASRLAGAS